MDFKNAFNNISHRQFLNIVKKDFPEIYNFINFCYGGISDLQWLDFIINSEVGSQQGDPLGPLLFALVLHCFVKILQTMCQFSLWYLDDGNLIVNKTQLIDVIKVLQSNEATEKGLFLNLSKCFIYSPKLPVWASSVKYFDPETEMEKTVPSGNSGTVVLGTPIGSQEFIDDFILQEILIPLEKLLENIKLLKDSHTEFFLFRNCATFCKIAFLLRTLPPAQGIF